MKQIERIKALLEELEGIADRSSELPPSVLARIHASVSKSEQMLGPRDVALAAPIPIDERDPQPHVDREALERHFQPREPYQ